MNIGKEFSEQFQASFFLKKMLYSKEAGTIFFEMGFKIQ